MTNWGGIPITLRDYFAARAMAAMLDGEDVPSSDPIYAMIARHAYRCADAMMEARNANVRVGILGTVPDD